MPGNFEQRLNDIAAKAKLLTQRYQHVAQQRDQAEAQVEKLTAELAAARRRVEELSSKVEYLRMASTVEIASGDLEQSRKFLSELVWEIDKCISQLSE